MHLLSMLYTEDKNRDLLRDILSKRFNDYTFCFGAGVWKGQEENSLVIHILHAPHEQSKVLKCAEDIRVQNNQECVIVTMQKVQQCNVT